MYRPTDNRLTPFPLWRHEVATHDVGVAPPPVPVEHPIGKNRALLDRTRSSTPSRTHRVDEVAAVVSLLSEDPSHGRCDLLDPEYFGSRAHFDSDARHTVYGTRSLGFRDSMSSDVVQ